MINKGKFITIEGGEGAGKTTNIEFMLHYLRQHGKDVVVTREPGGTMVAEKIRAVLLEKDEEPLCDLAELLLIFAARVQHVENKLRPALDTGKWVICDRFVDSSYAYQAGGRAIDEKKLETLEKWVVPTLKPELTLLIDIPVDIGMARVHRRNSPDRFESEEISFYQKVRKRYLTLAKKHHHRIKVIDGRQSIRQVQSEIRGYLDLLLNDR